MTRLRSEVQAEHYTLHVTVNPRAKPFDCDVQIRLRAPAGTRSLELHSVDLEWKQCELADAHGPLAIRAIEDLPKRETRRLQLSRPTAPGSLELRIRCRGALRGDLRGLYAARSGPYRYALTQLEASDARRFFPCLDEPDKKARFQVSVTTPAGNRALSNAPAERTQRSAGRVTTHFRTTPPISTYLVALIVGDLESSPVRQCGHTPIRIWGPPGRRAQMSFALEAATASLSRLESYFGMPYPYEKLDLIAVPDFEFGAMENVGAVIFRETLLLVDPKTVTQAERRRVAEVIAHELAHMWFGNLVTMAWWDDLWLNEAFATWMAYAIVDEWKPEWKMWLDFEHGRASALQLDALESTHPIYVPVRTPEAATENFDRITYEKGAAVVRMIERWVGRPTFRRGVRAYLRAHRESNARGADLWSALEKASGQPIGPLVQSWIERGGFPLVEVSETAETEPAPGHHGGLRLRLRQQRFHARGGPARRAGAEPPWPVPISLRLGEQGRRPRTERALLERREQEVAIPTRGTVRWVYGNAQESGFYRPLHAAEPSAALRAHFHELGADERMGLLDHQWAAVRAGYAPLAFLLDLLPELGDEHEPHVLQTFARGFGHWLEDPLLPALREAEAERVRGLLCESFGPPLHALGWKTRRGEDPELAQRRAALLQLAAGVGEDEELLLESTERAAALLRDRRSLDPDLAGVMVPLAARWGTPALYRGYLRAMRGAQTAQERVRFQMALTEFRDAALCEQTAELLLGRDIRTQDVVIVLARLLRNPVAREPVWRFVQKRWQELHERIPPASASRLVAALPELGASRRSEVAAFLRAHPLPTARRAVKQAMERFTLDARLLRRTRAELRTWLRDHGGTRP